MNKWLKVLIVVMVILLPVQSLFAGGQSEEPVEILGAEAPAARETFDELGVPESLMERFSYAFGIIAGQSFMQQGIELDPQYFARGLSDIFAGDEFLISFEEIDKALDEYQMQIMEEQQAFEQEIASMNLEAAEDFLAENRLRDSVNETASGLQYEILHEGDGDYPTADDVVTVHYEGTFLDGMVFDSSYFHGEPATFPLSGVIPGWTEGVQLMRVGSIYKFFLHPDLAYGVSGSPPHIDPNELLIFEVELIGIQ